MATPPVRAQICSDLESVRFVLLMRHAKHIPAKTLAAKSERMCVALWKLANLLLLRPASQVQLPQRELSATGFSETRAVAEGLKKHIEEAGDGFHLGGIISAPSDEAKATAQIVNEVFKSQFCVEVAGLLDPKIAFLRHNLKKIGSVDLAKKVKTAVDCAIMRLEPKPTKNQAILIIGHLPILGWLGHDLSGEAHPMVHSELLCLERQDKSKNRHLRWTISPFNAQAIEDLKEKIRSKMDIAKLLSSFLGAGLSFLLATMANPLAAQGLGDHIWPFLVGSLSLLVALGFFLWTMCSYDTLLMPHYLWAETPRGPIIPPAWVVERPPSSASWILYQNMIRIWGWQFLPATWLMLFGLFLLAGAVFGVRLFPSSCFAWAWHSMFAIWFVTIVAFKGWENRADIWAARKCTGLANMIRHLCGPWVGSED